MFDSVITGLRAKNAFTILKSQKWPRITPKNSCFLDDQWYELMQSFWSKMSLHFILLWLSLHFYRIIIWKPLLPTTTGFIIKPNRMLKMANYNYFGPLLLIQYLSLMKWYSSTWRYRSILPNYKHDRRLGRYLTV